MAALPGTHNICRLCWMHAGSRLTQGQVLRSMRLFAAEVMPAFPHT